MPKMPHIDIQSYDPCWDVRIPLNFNLVEDIYQIFLRKGFDWHHEYYKMIELPHIFQVFSNLILSLIWEPFLCRDFQWVAKREAYHYNKLLSFAVWIPNSMKYLQKDKILGWYSPVWVTSLWGVQREYKTVLTLVKVKQNWESKSPRNKSILQYQIEMI